MGINLDDFVIRRGSTGDVTGVTVDTATGLTGGGTSGDIPVAIGTVPLANGGTGATTAAAARTALGLGSVAVLNTADIKTRYLDSSSTGTDIVFDSYVKYVTATGPLGTTITGSGTSADPYVITLTSPDTTGSSYTLPAATTTALGGIKVAATSNSSVPSPLAASPTSNRTYQIELQTSGLGVVYVPWTDTVYTLPAATSSALGGVKIVSTAASAPVQVATTTANRNYSIQHMTSGTAVVNVPWTDTTYNLATASVSGLCQVYNQIEADSVVCEEEVEGRRYKIQHDADTDLSVCVPWTDTVYTHPTSAGYKHIPAGGSAGQFLKYSSAGTAVWASDNNTTYSEATSSAEGLMSTAHHDKLDGIEANADVTDATNVEAAGALMDSELTDLPGVKGMTVANKADLASPTFTGTPAAPTAGDGTNTTQIATTAFVKQELDARHSYQYINFSFKITGLSNNNWYFPGQDGVNYYLWGNNVAGSAEPTDVAIGTTITVDRYDYQSGIVIPKACELVSFHGQIRHHGYSPNTIKPAFGLFKAAMPSDGTTSDLTPSCIAFNDDSLIGSGNRLNRINKIESTHTASLSAYDIIYPAYGAIGDIESNGTIRGMITIVLKTLIP